MPVDSKVGRRHWGWLILLVTFWKFQHFNLVSKIFQKLFKPLPCHKSIGKMLHAICISAVAVSLRWASCGPWASCFSFILYTLFCLFYIFDSSLCPQLKRSWRGILLLGRLCISPSICPCMRPSITVFDAKHNFWTMNARVLKFHIWIFHDKIAAMYFFPISIMPLTWVMALWKKYGWNFVSKISQKLLKLEPWNLVNRLVLMSRWPD